MRMNKTKGNQGEETDKALATYNKKSKARCTNCGKLGHKSTVCWDLVGKPDKKTTTTTTQGNKSEIVCHYCKTKGHIKKDCPKLKAKKSKEEAAAAANMTVDGDVVLSTGYSKLEENIWIGDSGATSHITNDDTGLYDVKTVNYPVKVGDGGEVIATMIGKL